MAADDVDVVTRLREVALSAAVDYLRAAGHTNPDELVNCARAAYRFLNPVMRLYLTRGDITDQATGAVANPPEGELPMATVLKDSEQVDFTVEADDAKGYPTVDPSAITAAIDDTTVASVSQNGATITVVAGAPGNAVLSVSDGTITVTEAINVTPGDVAAFKLTPGTPTAQAA